VPPSPDAPLFFVDECLGRRFVGAALEAAGESTVSMPKGTADVEWLERGGMEGWLCLTKDHRLLTRPNELAMLRGARVRVFAVGKKMTGPENARRFVGALPILKRAASAIALSFFARIDPSGDLVVRLEAGERLARPWTFRATAEERQHFGSTA